MKTNLLIASIVSCCLVSCIQEKISDLTNEEEENEFVKNSEIYKLYNTGNVIKFSIGEIARSTSTNETLLKSSNGFGFFGYSSSDVWGKEETNSSFMHNKNAVYKSFNEVSFWDYGEPKEWPKEKFISFFAYAPFASETNGITIQDDFFNKAPILKYTIKLSDLTKMTDIICDRSDNIRNIKFEDTTNGTVEFIFSHILSSVILKVKVKEKLPAGQRAFITDFKLKSPSNQISYKGNYSFEKDIWENNEYINGDLILSSILDYKSPNDINNFSLESIEITDATTAKSIFKDNNELFFIPINNNNGTSREGDIKAIITYYVINNNKSYRYDKEVNIEAGALAKGMTSNYVFSFDLKAEKIDICAEVKPWIYSNENLNIK